MTVTEPSSQNEQTAAAPAHRVRWLNAIDDLEAPAWDALFPAGNPFLRHAFLSNLL